MRRNILKILSVILILSLLLSGCGMDLNGKDHEYNVYDLNEEKDKHQPVSDEEDDEVEILDKDDVFEEDAEEDDADDEIIEEEDEIEDEYDGLNDEDEDDKLDGEDTEDEPLHSKVEEIDKWGFLNSSLDSLLGVKGYWISLEDYTRLIKDASDIDIFCMSFYLNKENEKENPVKWGGSCYGMSSTDVLVNRAQILSTSINASDTLAGSTVSKEVVSAINYYHVQQFSSLVQDERRAFMAKNAQEQISVLKELAESGEPFLIDYKWKYGGHSVMGYGISDEGYIVTADYLDDDLSFQYKVEIYDNAAYPENEENYDLYFNESGDWCIPGRNLYSYDNVFSDEILNNACFMLVQSKLGMINLIDYSTGEASEVYKKSQDSSCTRIMVKSGATLDIICGTEKVSVSKGDLPEESVRNGYSVSVPCLSDTIATSWIYINIPNNKASYTFDMKEDMDLTFFAGNSAIRVDSTEAGVVTFDAIEKAVNVECESKPEECIIEIITNHDDAFGVEGCNEITIDNASSKDISIEMSPTGIDISGTDLSGVQISGAVYGENTEIDIKENVNEVSLEKSGKNLVVSGDTDGDGKKEVLDKTPIPKNDSKIILKNKTAKYTGKAIDIDDAAVEGDIDKIVYLYYKDKKCTKEIRKHTAVGTYYVQAYGFKNDYLVRSNIVKLKIKPAKPVIKLKKTSFTVKEKELSLDNKIVTLKKDGNSGKLTFKKVSGNKYITVSESGKVTVKKGLKKGRYTIKIKATSA